MRIEIHIRETDSRGKYVGRRNAFVESCRVYKEAGDGVRLDNLANIAYNFFNYYAKLLTKAWRESKTADGFLANIGMSNDQIKPQTSKGENKNENQ